MVSVIISYTFGVFLSLQQTIVLLSGFHQLKGNQPREKEGFLSEEKDVLL